MAESDLNLKSLLFQKALAGSEEVDASSKSKMEQLETHPEPNQAEGN